MPALLKYLLLFLIFILPKINYAQKTIKLDSVELSSMENKLKEAYKNLPISYTTENMMIEKINHSFFSKYPINKEISADKKQFIEDFKTEVRKTESELIDTSKYFWTLERQIQNLAIIKRVISLKKIEVDDPIKLTKSFNTELIKQFPLGFKGLTRDNKELLLSILFSDVLNEYKGNKPIILEDIIPD